MKRLSALVLLAASAAATFCQAPNKQLQGLEEYLRQQGFSSYREQSSTWGKGITHKLGAGFHFYITDNPPMHESMSQEQREKAVHRLWSRLHPPHLCPPRSGSRGKSPLRIP